MRRNLAIIILIVSGVGFFALGVGIWSSPETAFAMPAHQSPQPPPERPVVNPNPQPGGGGGGGGGSDDVVVTPVPAGRITGTVINHSTGAPTPNIEVSVGGVIVRSDVNGNYERVNLFPGTYIVRLHLGSDQGVALQDPQVVVLMPDENIIVHRYFRPAGAAAAEQPGPASVPEPVAAADTDNVGVTAQSPAIMPSSQQTFSVTPVVTNVTNASFTANHSNLTERHSAFGRLRPF